MTKDKYVCLNCGLIYEGKFIKKTQPRSVLNANGKFEIINEKIELITCPKCDTTKRVI